MIKKTIVLLLFVNLGFSQMTDTIIFSYPKSLYGDIARDSVKKLYDKQYNYFYKINDGFNTSQLMSFNCKFEELDFLSIPMYRLYRDGFENYDCSKNIEDFIVFDEYNKYQVVYTFSKNNLYSIINVPNEFIEQDKTYTQYKEKNRNEFLFTSYLETLLAHKEVIKEKETRLFNKDISTYFFFKLYGLGDVIFVLERKTGILFANNYHNEEYGELKSRMLANDFLRKFVGEKVIKELCLGHYLEIDPSINADYYKPCDNYEKIKSNKVFLKIKEK